MIVDLFSGCSGLGLGAQRAGFHIGLSVDVDPILTSSHKLNFPKQKLLLKDVATITGKELAASAGRRIEGIVGGPPCQGFSEIGRADPKDPRRDLLNHFFRLVAEAKPAFFLMENVRGLAFSKNRPFLDSALEQVARRYTVVGPIILEASDLGAATKRPRLYVLGYDPRKMDAITDADLLKARRTPATVKDAIGDLSDAVSEGVHRNFDEWRLHSDGNFSSYAKALRSRDCRTTGLRRTPHRADVIERFATVLPGGLDAVGRHPRLAWEKQCPTLRAGTGADKGSRQAVRPLHPDEPRVITVREAARLQGFPDWFRFHPTVWHSFRMIGNSVSPTAAQTLLSVVKGKMGRTTMSVAAE